MYKHIFLMNSKQAYFRFVSNLRVKMKKELIVREL